jgi:hypothetical protein
LIANFSLIDHLKTGFKVKYIQVYKERIQITYTWTYIRLDFLRDEICSFMRKSPSFFFCSPTSRDFTCLPSFVSFISSKKMETWEELQFQ